MATRRLLLGSGLAGLAATALRPRPARAATRVVLDQVGRQVAIPDRVSRMVVLQHHSLDTLAQLGALDQVVGVVKDWRGLIGPGFERLAPSLARLPSPGTLTSANIEELLALSPDVVICTYYAPPQMLQAIEATGLPVVQLAFFDVPASERGKLNPVLPDEKKAYSDGLLNAIRLLGEVTGKQERAAALVSECLAGRALVEARTAHLPETGRTSMYMANPELTTYGSGKYTAVIMELAGGLNVARSMNGFGKVTMEQVLAWNPDAVIVQDRYAAIAQQIEADPAWSPIRAVVNRRITVTPEYVKPWGNPTPESMALGEAWMAKALHPELFADIDLTARADAFYRRFYGMAYDGR